jgi:hypothetical protein
MSDSRAFLTSLERELAELEAWRAQVLATLAAARLFPILARSGGVASGERAFVGELEVALPLELGWAAAQGEAVVDAELRYARQALSELFEDVWHDLHGYEKEAFEALLHALGAAIGPDPRRGAKDAIGAALYAAEQLGARGEAEEIAFWRGALAGAAALAERSRARSELAAVTGEHSGWLGRAVAGETGDEDDEEAEGGDEGGNAASDESTDEVTEERAGAPWIAQLARADEARGRWIAEVRGAREVPAWREPTGIPARYRVSPVGRGPSSQQGKLSVSGHEHVGLVDASTGEVLFAPPWAVALGMSPDERELISWRVERRAGASGVGRADYDWILERYAWPERTLASAHVVADRTLIAWHWPGELAVPLAGGGRLLVLGARSEDDFVRLYLVTGVDGAVRETTRRHEAEEWLAPAG